MSVLDKMTKAELREQIDTLQAKLDRAVQPTTTAAPPPPVAEADALRGCVRALDDLVSATSKRASYSDGYAIGTASYAFGSTAVQRVLRHLAAKYDVPLIETQHEPCQRPHVDDIDTYAITNALSDALRTGPIRAGVR